MKFSSLASLVALAAVCAASHAQTFGHRSYPGIYTYNHADLNNDGREDLIFHTPHGFAVSLTTGSATYAAPVTYNVPNNLPAATVSIDINNDGKLDEVAFNRSSPGFYIYLNNGDGTLTLSSTVDPAGIADVEDIVAGDFNHDGYADLAVLTRAVNGTGNALHVFFNNHAGGFTAGPVTGTPTVGEMTIGDFDGDGAADLAITGVSSGTVMTYLYFGDNTGHFTAVNASSPHQAFYYLMDLDGDGKSDLVGVSAGDATGQFSRDVWVVYGNQFRNVIESDIPLNGYALPWSWGLTVPEKSPSVDVADLDGGQGGFRDFAIVEAQNSDGTGTRTLDIKLGSLNRQWSDEVPVYSNSNLDFGVAVLRATDALKPDLLVDTSDFTDNTKTAQVFVNDSTGYFGGCEFPNTAIGINVCSPTTYSASSPALFSASAAGQTTIRKVELWIDGVKKYQETADHDYSHYGMLGASATLKPGTHQITILAAGYDNLEIKKSYTVTVQ